MDGLRAPPIEIPPAFVAAPSFIPAHARIDRLNSLPSVDSVGISLPPPVCPRPRLNGHRPAAPAKVLTPPCLVTPAKFYLLAPPLGPFTPAPARKYPFAFMPPCPFTPPHTQSSIRFDAAPSVHARPARKVPSACAAAPSVHARPIRLRRRPARSLCAGRMIGRPVWACCYSGGVYG